MSDHQSLIEEVRREHYIHTYTPPNGPKTIPYTCAKCGARWPCHAARLADALEQQAEQNKSEVAALATDLSAALARAARLAGYTQHWGTCQISQWFRATDLNDGVSQGPEPTCSCGLSAALGLAAGKGEEYQKIEVKENPYGVE